MKTRHLSQQQAVTANGEFTQQKTDEQFQSASQEGCECFHCVVQLRRAMRGVSYSQGKISIKVAEGEEEAVCRQWDEWKQRERVLGVSEQLVRMVSGWG